MFLEDTIDSLFISALGFLLEVTEFPRIMSHTLAPLFKVTVNVSCHFKYTDKVFLFQLYPFTKDSQITKMASR